MHLYCDVCMDLPLNGTLPAARVAILNEPFAKLMLCYLQAYGDSVCKKMFMERIQKYGKMLLPGHYHQRRSSSIFFFFQIFK